MTRFALSAVLLVLLAVVACAIWFVSRVVSEAEEAVQMDVWW